MAAAAENGSPETEKKYSREPEEDSFVVTMAASAESGSPETEIKDSWEPGDSYVVLPAAAAESGSSETEKKDSSESVEGSYVVIPAAAAESGSPETEKKYSWEPEEDSYVVTVVKEGPLGKKSDVLGLWKDMYFYLLSDGTMKGFKSQPASPFDKADCNHFTVYGCEFIEEDEPDRFVFTLRSARWTESVERTLSAATDDEREDWIDAILLLTLPRVTPSTFYKDENKKCVVEDFKFIKILGKGRFGKAALCRESQYLRPMSMKIIPRSENLFQDRINLTLAELKVIERIRHPFLVGCIAYFHYGDDIFCFVTEFLQAGDLAYHLKKNVRFPEKRAKFYAAEIVCTLGYLHTNKLIYRDLKLENVLLDDDGHIKLADFGQAKIDICYGDNTRSLSGPKYCLAPEMVKDDVYGPAADWWALGVVLFQMLTGDLPFDDKDKDNLCLLITESDLVYPDSISEDARSFLSSLLEKDPEKRLGSNARIMDYMDVFEHPFFNDLNLWDIILKMIPPPFVPRFGSKLDTRYFNPEFTKQSVELTPPPMHPMEKLCEYGDAHTVYRDISSSMEDSWSSKLP